MEYALSTTTTTTLLTISKTLYLHCHFSATRSIQSQLSRRIFNRNLHSLRGFTPSSPSSLRSLSAVVVHPVRSRLQCVSSSAASFASGGGGVGGIGGDGSGGGGGDGALEEKASSVVDGFESSSDVIILDVGGMSCGGCAASVKRILESQPQVSSASVNLTTETAVVWPVSEAKVLPNWQKNLGVELAKHLTSYGFKSNLRDSSGENFFEAFERKMNQKRNQLKESGRELAVSWALCAVCLFGHLSHFLGAKFSWLHALHSTGFHLSLSLFTLLGPGRQLIVDGLKSLIRGSPNMNTLVGLGALSSFGVSSLAALVPKLLRTKELTNLPLVKARAKLASVEDLLFYLMMYLC